MYPRCSRFFPARFSGAAAWVTVILLLACGAARAAAPTLAVLLYDGKLPDQVQLDAAAREALKLHAEKVSLRTMHAGRAETVPFLRRYHLTRADAPLLLVMSSTEADARILRRIPLTASAGSAANLATLMAALRLPVPRGGSVAPPAGPVVTVVTDGGAEEKRFLVGTAGPALRDKQARLLDATSQLIYRLPISRGLRTADLHADLQGNFALELGDNPQGPWTPLFDSYASFGAAEDAVREPVHAIASLNDLLSRLPGDLFVRVHTNGHGANRARLSRLEVVALDAKSTSLEGSWTVEAERLRTKHLAEVLPGGTEGTPLAGLQMQDLTLTAARSPYLMSGDVTVPLGRTLTVEPGVKVRVVGNRMLRIDGRLLARGTAEKPIVLEPARLDQPDDWKGVIFAPLRNVGSGVGTVLEYCRIRHAAAVELNDFRGEVSHCVFEGGLSGATLRGGGSGQFHHNRLERCVTGLSVHRGGGVVTDNEWLDCTVGLAVSELDPKAALRIENNSIAGSMICAVHYLKQPSRELPPLVLANNHWSGTPEARMVGGGANAAEVRFDPRLPSRPASVGPGW